MRTLLYVLLTLTALGLANATVSAAELSGSTTDAKMPAGADFSNGPEGGGAQLVGTDHVPSGAEFSNGPAGGAATVDPTPRRIPSGAEFSNGPAGICQE